MSFNTAREELLTTIADSATSAPDKFTNAQALSELVSSRREEKRSFDTRLIEAEKKYNGSNNIKQKHLPDEVLTTHQIYTKDPDKNDFVFVAMSNAYRGFYVSDDRGETWYAVEFDGSIAYDSWRFDFTINPDNNSFRIFWMSANIIYASDEIDMSTLKINGSKKIATGTAITQNGTKQEFFVAHRHKDGHIFCAFTEHDGSYYNTYFTQLRNGQTIWDAVALLKSHDSTYHDNIATNIVMNRAGDSMYFAGSNMSNSVAGAWWTFEIIFNPSNGSGAFEINRFYTYTRGSAPYYLLYRSRAVLVNDGSYNATLYILPAYTTNTMVTPFFIPISTFNTHTEWVNNTDTSFSSYPLHTYGQYIFPNGKFVSYRRWTTIDKGQNFRIGWASYSSCNDQYTGWHGGCYSTIYTAERPYQLIDLFTTINSE